MREIKIEDVGNTLQELLLEKDPIDEDVGIFDGSGEIVGVVIPKKAYDFFLKKVEEEEDRIDSQSVEEFNNSGEKDI
ncbi:hypothetical protein [Marinibactrum halimedae]|uniref:Uncharacterized protein n=1 Tax=Marinibactrum halimedae TaxID=1444977 RepID=A0AA37T9T2_9GAMM|nr:hypothetical protein [Marinibactrum halimedae]MCD9458530.1 hypothetical protein [Marinibactrum halimedae]GLS26606.1 hypothetical protein GCM10007877_23220 [Marinibactrum halimedae]